MESEGRESTGGEGRSKWRAESEGKRRVWGGEERRGEKRERRERFGPIIS